MTGEIRADQIGSLLRPEQLLNARDDFHAGRLTARELQSIEDAAIGDALRLQREVGLEIFTDGEMRRDAWQTNFSQAVEGFEPDYPVRELRRPDGSLVTLEVHAKAVVGKLRAIRRLTGVDAQFLKAHSPGPFKITMPGPTTVGRAGWREGTTDTFYGSRRELYQECADIIRAEMECLVAEGASYIQLDEAFTNFARESTLEAMREQGVDPDKALTEQIEVENTCYDAVHDQTVALGAHLCRGSRTGSSKPWLIDPQRQGREFDWLAERLFDQLHANRFLFEWDSGFQALRFLPRGKVVVLGIVSSLDPKLEPPDLIMRCVEAATRYCPVEQLALSTQCGFQGSGTRDGGHMTMDEQRRKLELVVETARRIWG